MIASTGTLFVLFYFVPVLLAKLVSILISFAVNFPLSHFVVFRVARRLRPDQINNLRDFLPAPQVAVLARLPDQNCPAAHLVACRKLRAADCQLNLFG